MFDHIGLRTPDLTASVAFYRAALAPLGHQLVYEDETVVGFGPTEGSRLWLHAAPTGASSATHLALAAQTRDAVDRFHAAALAAGGRDNGAPGPRPDYGPTYYAAFVLDPDGNNLEAMFQG
jgi:catechol 2,3-dioxygenase-like lactoylglutathione lyase family enzyme